MASGKLYLVPTLLGEGIDPHSQLPMAWWPTLEHIRHFAVEDVRSARRFLRGLFKQFPIDDSQFYPIGKHGSAENQTIISACSRGFDVAVLSEAGCPGIADPGAHLVAMAHQNNVEVVPWVGPSSILLALMASGMNGQQFAFRGYLPVQNAERKQKIKWMEGLVERTGETQLFIETPFRNESMVAALKEILKPTTLMGVAVDLGMPSQVIRVQTAGAFQLPGLHKRPAVFFMGRSF
jgi:16S rRNA (cytidine1402-2'-O)-methyltransferase